MKFYNKIFMLKKQKYEFSNEELMFFRYGGFNFEAQYIDPTVFYSKAVNSSVNIVLFDPLGYIDIARIGEILCSLQDFTDCRIILCHKLPEGYDAPFSYEKFDNEINDTKIRISSAILKIKKEQENDPDNEKYTFYHGLSSLLLELGFDSSDLGFGYICDAVYYIYKENRPNLRIVKDVYSYVARINNTKDYRVERNIRHALERAMMNCNHKALQADEKLKCFDNLMFDVTARNFINALVSFKKYKRIF